MNNLPLQYNNMILNAQEIRDSNIIIGLKDSKLRNASYDMSIETIIDMKGGKQDYYKLPPQGMAIVVFQEQIRLTKDLIGLAHVKTSLTQKGIMATNIGIIDPCYDGFLSTLLINFGSDSYSLHKNDSCLRLTFDRIKDSYDSKPFTAGSKEDYIKARQSDTDNLAEKFLNLSSVTKDVSKEVGKRILGLGIIFSVASFAIGMYFQHKTATEKDQDKIVKGYEIQNTLLIDQNKKLQNQVDSVAEVLRFSDKRLKNLEYKSSVKTGTQ